MPGRGITLPCLQPSNGHGKGATALAKPVEMCESMGRDTGDGMEEAAQHNQSSCFVPRDDSVVFWASKREHTYGLSVSDTE